jgi:tetratricopeptide (TPR) repeat protein
MQVTMDRFRSQFRRATASQKLTYRWLPIGLMFLAAFSLLVSPCFAGGGPENLVLVVNSDSPTSKLIANLYVEGRQIPARNVIYLDNVPASETTDLAGFRDSIIRPIFQQMEERKLANIDYIVYSADFPTSISVAEHLGKLREDLGEPDQSSVFQSQFYSPNGSINSLTFFAGAVLADYPGYMLLDANTYYRQPAQASLRRPFIGESQQKFEAAIKTFDQESGEEYDQAIKTLEKLAGQNPHQVAVLYWLARFYGQQGDATNATGWLKRAVRAGWKFRTQTKSDLAFAAVQEDPGFQALVARIPDLPFDFIPTQGFKHVYAWGLNGYLNSDRTQGNRYFLSTVLAATRRYGNTEREAVRQLSLSMKADETYPTGTFYFSDTDDIRNQTRKPNYRYAIDALERLGHNVEVIDTPLPVGRRDVLGLTTGAATFSWIASGSKFVPGAIGDNLTSFGGRLSDPGQTKLSEFLRNNAAGASGTVVEPYALQAKFPHPLIHVHYARGCTLAESFYQSLQSPFQQLIVGDALCQPFATRPTIEVAGVTPGEKVAGQIELTIDATASPVPIGRLELYVDGVMVLQSQMRQQIKFDTTGVPDGYHELRFVVVANDPVQTTGRAIIPIQVDNEGRFIQLKAEKSKYLVTDEVNLVAKSNYGDSIELVHNMRSIAKKTGREVEFKIPGQLLGRGPVKLEAVAMSKTGKGVASMPIRLNIEGRLSTRNEKRPARQTRQTTTASEANRSDTTGQAENDPSR